MAINTWHSFHFFWTVLLLLLSSFVIRCLRYALGTIKRSTNRAIKTHFIPGTWQRTLWQTFFRGFYDLQPAFFWSLWNLLYPPVYLCVFRACATHFSLSFSRPWGCHKKVSAQFLARIPKIRWHFHYYSLLFGFFFELRLLLSLRRWHQILLG